MQNMPNPPAVQLHGLHHVTAVSGDMGVNLDFFTRILGLRLVKKTVNQDDVSAYHMYYADKIGSPGTDMTFFDWPQTITNRRGTDSVVTTMFRVNGRAALDYWMARFEEYKVIHGPLKTIFDHDAIRFEDREGQRLALIDDGGVPYEGQLWDGVDIPPENAIRGFYGVALSIPHLSQLTPMLTEVLGMHETQRATNTNDETMVVYSMANGGPGKEIHVIEQPTLSVGRLGRGGIHHVALRVTNDDEQRAWRERLSQYGLRVSPFIDRFYFHSIYFQISNGILFEIATDGPGFTGDESLETLGQRLALPPFLEGRRAEIEAGLKPIPVIQTS